MVQHKSYVMEIVFTHGILLRYLIIFCKISIWKVCFNITVIALLVPIGCRQRVSLGCANVMVRYSMNSAADAFTLSKDIPVCQFRHFDSMLATFENFLMLESKVFLWILRVISAYLVLRKGTNRLGAQLFSCFIYILLVSYDWIMGRLHLNFLKK